MKLPAFDPPAQWNDFAGDARKEREFRDVWSKSVNRWTENAILGNPWSVLYDNHRDYYFNPLTTDVPDSAPTRLIPWTAFPNRILVSFPNASQAEQWRYADEGPPDVGGKPYRPEGPRGWQDEYCEWSVTRNAEGAITRVDFTCENPEYWFCLWQVSPERVLALYRQLVGPHVALEDLYLRDAQGRPVVDRETGRPAYDAINKWNNSTTRGVVHLISPPNTLGAEIYLAGAATLLRERNGDPITDRDVLIQCSRYGAPGRNSDPFIGAEVNALVRQGVRVTLKNPVGLYIQQPDFSRFQLPFTAPDGVKVNDFWKLVRGRPGFGLHAVFEVPPELGFTVSDLSIDGIPIQYGAQIAQTFQIALTGVAIDSTLAPPQKAPCQAVNMNPTPSPQVLQDMNLYAANSRSSQTPRVEQGSTVTSLVLLAGDTRKGAKVAFSGQGVTAEVTDSHLDSDGNLLMQLAIRVAPDASPGDRSLTLTNPDGTQGPAAPGMLEVVPAGSLNASVSLHALPALRGGASQGADTLTHSLAARLRRR
ncbi:hypothetical protein [Corallococcus macrosporus]|uniref:Uncharacterized protein n=1 Tax=Myxococcus fulvus (strain ATCC BAA-855 / HW-1) TaxID=483219 RepID=F8CM33_MYXFH|nr:hypothetical protein [Corallococcus macrosporus]AEI62801.1 hypothetical protein LILAB_04400 [Corallococcus macrosporus]